MNGSAQGGRICPRGASFYTWQAGNTLENVASQAGITVNSLREANPTVDFADLAAGDVICLPSALISCFGAQNYTVQAGDTLTKIARAFRTTTAELRRLNPGVLANNLQIGQVICVPNNTSGDSACGAGFQQHAICAGQTYSQILVENDISYNAMRQINPDVRPSAPLVGQSYCVPEDPADLGTCSGGRRTYRISQSLTLGELAAALNTTQGALLQLNPSLRPSNFVEGQIICIP